jgi:hypothetical protein
MAMEDYQPEELGREVTTKRASKLIAEKPIIQGSLSEYLRTCGTSGCRCHHSGPKHAAVYLAIRYGKKRTSIFIPREVLPYVQECVANHQHLQKMLEIISKDCIEVALAKKRTLKKQSRKQATGS